MWYLRCFQVGFCEKVLSKNILPVVNIALNNLLFKLLIQKFIKLNATLLQTFYIAGNYAEYIYKEFYGKCY